jgi:putative zinc finger/helix-turn-helix YgiT family protein
MKPFPWKCGTCRRQALAPATVPYTTAVDHDGRTYTVALPALAVLRCGHCGALVLDDAAHETVSRAFRYEARLLTPAQVRQGREGLGLNQKQLAGFLDIAVSTLSRWETGAQVQQRAMDKLLRGFFEVPEFRHYLGFQEPAPADAAPVRPAADAGTTTLKVAVVRPGAPAARTLAGR